MRNELGQFIKGHKLSVGSKHPMFGKKHSIKTRRKMSIDRKGKQVGLDNPFWGKRHSLESKNKISKAGIGRKISKSTKIKHSINTTKEKNPNWKGGIYESNKRIYVRVDDANTIKPYKLLHRIIVEERIGRKLEKNEVVHHIDNDSLNNKINNLMVFTSNSAHRRFHGNKNNVNINEIIFDGRII